MRPFHLRYGLSRAQRLGVLLAMEGIAQSLFILLLFSFFCLTVVINARQGKLCDAVFFAAIALGIFLLWNKVLFGLLDVLLFKWREEDLLVDHDSAGILIGGKRWHFFFDGITSIERYHRDLWTIRHFNGLVLHIPTALIKED